MNVLLGSVHTGRRAEVFTPDPYITTPYNKAVFDGRSARTHGQWIPHVIEHLARRLVEAHVGPPRLIGLLIHVKHLFHLADKGCVLLGRDDPLLLQVGLEFVFLSVRRTVSRESWST